MGKREHIYEIIAENIRKERRRLGITQNGRMYHWILSKVLKMAEGQ